MTYVPLKLGFPVPATHDNGGYTYLSSPRNLGGRLGKLPTRGSDPENPVGKCRYVRHRSALWHPLPRVKLWKLGESWLGTLLEFPVPNAPGGAEHPWGWTSRR